MNFILDKERNFNKNKDFLDYSNYIFTLREIIKNAPDTSFTIGLFGGWGSGKSSIINTVKDNFKDEKIKFITYDAWKYSDDSFRRTLLITISQDPDCNRNDYKDYEFLNSKFYTDTQKEVSNQLKIHPYCFIFLIFIIIIFLSILYIFGIKYLETDLIAIAALFVSIISLSKYDLKTQINEHFIFAPEQFDVYFKKLIDYICQSKDKQDNEKQYNKIVLVIDNLDRCSGSEVIEKLKTIKTFLGDCENIIFLIPLDDYSLKKYLFKLKSDKTNKDSYDMNLFVNEFLRKIFDVSLRIKNMNNINIKEYGDQIQREYNLEISKDTWLLISDTFVNNPRRIIQFFNNLQVELNNYEPNFRDKYETYICKILIISEEYPNVYKYLSNHFMKAMNLNQIEKNTIEHLGNECKEFIIFNKRTSYVSNINEVKTFNKIFYNSEGFNNLPKNINNAINSNDYDQIDKFCTDDKNKENLLKSLCSLTEDEYHKDISSVIDKIKLLLHLYKNETNTTKFPLLIEEILKNQMDPIMDENDTFKTLLLYSRNIDEDYNQNSLIYTIVNTFNEKFRKEDENIDISSLREILSVFHENKDVLRSVSVSVHYIFKRYKDDEDEILKFFNDLPSFKLEKTFYTDLAEYLINHSFIIGFKCLNCFLDCLESQAKMHILDYVIENLNNKMYRKINVPCLVPLLKSLKQNPSFDTIFTSLKQALMRLNYNYYHGHNISNWLDKEVYK